MMVNSSLCSRGNTGTLEGVLNHTIRGVPASMPIPADEKPLLYQYGTCMLLID